MVWLAAAFAGGIALGAQSNPATGLLSAIVLLLLLMLWRWLFPALRTRDILLLVGVFAIAGMGNGFARARSLPLDPLAEFGRDHLQPGEQWTLEGVVRAASLYRPGEGLRIVVDVDTLQGSEGPIPLGGGVTVRCPDPTALHWPGERLRIRGRYDPTLSTVNFDLIGPEDYYRARGVHAACSTYGRDIETLTSPPLSLGYAVARLRQAQADLFARYVPAESVPFVLAVWLGESLLTDPREYDDFVASGTAHVLSVSGVHVAIVYATMLALLSGLVRNRRLRALLLIGTVLGFALLAGARTATLRAALMFAIYLSAELVAREPDAPTSLGLCAFLFLAWNPRLIFDAGFLLSFASVASILIFNEQLIARMPKILGGVRPAIATTASAQLLPFPLAAHFFHVLPVYGLLANLIVVPLLTAVLWLCVVTLIVASVWDAPGQLFGQAVHGVVVVLRAVVSGVASVPGSRLSVSSPTLYAVPMYWAAAWCGLQALSREKDMRRWLIAGLGCVALVVVLWSPWRQACGVDVIDVGHGDAILVQSPGGGTLLIDGGDQSEYRDCGRTIVGPFLQAHGVRHLDYVVCSHPDRDHSGGLFHVLRNFSVGTLVLAGVPTAHPLEAGLLRLAQEEGVPVQRVLRGDALALPGAQVEVLYPDATLGAVEKVNNLSVVLRVAWPGFSFLTTGDIEATAEERLVRAGECQADFLKVPHHGSATSSTPTLLAAVVPQVALCSTDAGPNRRPVAAAVERRYADLKIPLLRTEQLGGLRVRQRGEAYVVESARAVRGYALVPEAPSGGRVAK